ncbi:MAG: quinolinate synthase NadA [Mangrovibacterium sp.]
MDKNIASAMIAEHGHIVEDVSPDLNLIDEITRLKKEKNAVILCHYYATGDLQDIADFIGDSLQLALKAEETTADIIVFVGVHFMAETAKIINPTKKVILPDTKAGCSLADSAPLADFMRFKAEHPDHKVISYINCSAELKTVTDIVCTSSNAVRVVESFPKEQKLIFGPDRNLGNYLNSITGRDMLLWDGACMVHEQFSVEKIIQLMEEFPEADFIAHPECEKPVLLLAKHIGSTSSLLDYVNKSDKQTFIVATESGILHQMKKMNPTKVFIPAPANDSTCACNDCEYMKLNSIEKLYRCLKYEMPEVLLDEQLIEQAKRPIVNMIELSKSLGK